MADLVPPHGGLAAPVDRTVPAAEVEQFKQAAADLPRVPVSAADLSTVYRIADGTLSPLTGPMTKPVYDKVLVESVLTHNGFDYAWTIPIAFPLSEDLSTQILAGQTVALEGPDGELVGTVDVEDVYPWDKAEYLKSVYGTDRTDHPGGRW